MYSSERRAAHARGGRQGRGGAPGRADGGRDEGRRRRSSSSSAPRRSGTRSSRSGSGSSSRTPRSSWPRAAERAAKDALLPAKERAAAHRPGGKGGRAHDEPRARGDRGHGPPRGRGAAGDRRRPPRPATRGHRRPSCSRASATSTTTRTAAGRPAGSTGRPGTSRSRRTSASGPGSGPRAAAAATADAGRSANHERHAHRDDRAPRRSSCARSAPRPRTASASSSRRACRSRGSTSPTARAAEHAARVAAIREAARAAGREVAILADLPGPKVRLGPLRGRRGDARGGRDVHVPRGPRRARRRRRRDAGRHDATRASPATSRPGDRIHLSDGAVELVVRDDRRQRGDDDGRARRHRPLAAPASTCPPSASRCRRSATATASWPGSPWTSGIDLVGQSFVRTAADVADLRSILGPDGPGDRRQDRDAAGGRGVRVGRRWPRTA